MEEIFEFDNYVTGRAFAGRRQDCVALGNLIENHENVCIYDAPKSGKTSLLHQTLTNLRTSGRSITVPVCNMTAVRTKEDFAVRLVSSVMEQFCDGPSAYSDFVARWLPGTAFSFDAGQYEDLGRTAVLRSSLAPEDLTAALTLPYRVASGTSRDICLVFEEFQNIQEIKSSYGIIKEMEKIASGNRTSFSYVFTGSAINAMKLIFEYEKRFFRNVVHLPLSPVTEQEVIEHISSGFRPTGKVLDNELLRKPYRLFRGNMWYLNLMACLCDARAIGYISEKTVDDAVEAVVSMNVPRFRMIVDGLTGFQLSFLTAVLRGETRFSAADVIERYGLNSSANVKRVREALMKKEILTFTAKDEPVVIDPLFEFWFRREMLGKIF